MQAEGENQVGFERLANQRLLPPTFPRYTEVKTRSEASAYFRGLVERLLRALGVAQVSSFHGALDFFVDFTEDIAQTRLPGAFSRRL